MPVRRHQQILVIGISVSNLERTLMNGDDANTGNDNAKESDGNANKGDGVDDASERSFTMVTIFCPIHSYRQSCWFRSRFIFKVYCVLIHDSLHRLTVSGVCNLFAVFVQAE